MVNAWKIVFQKISSESSEGTYLGKWFTAFGGVIFMNVPKLHEIGEDRFLGDKNPDGMGSTMHYADIVKIEIEGEFKYGRLVGHQDVNRIFETLSSVDGILLKRVGQSIVIELSDTAIRTS